MFNCFVIRFQFYYSFAEYISFNATTTWWATTSSQRWYHGHLWTITTDCDHHTVLLRSRGVTQNFWTFQDSEFSVFLFMHLFRHLFFSFSSMILSLYNAKDLLLNFLPSTSSHLYVIRAFGGAPLAHLEARRLWRDTTIHNLIVRCSLVAPSAFPKIME